VGEKATNHQLELAAEMLRALADPARLRILLRLSEGELNVGQLAKLENDRISTISARLKVLLNARLVKRRRAGQAIIYSIADTHVLNLVDNVLAHAGEHH
jgi:ArsR family transcriptional regulator, lead/cadmium/zinc/bismuth-responsive transcriptional repressor